MMRVRSVVDGDVSEVVEESPSFYVVRGHRGVLRVEYRDQVVVVPDVQWVNVTEACEVQEVSDGVDVFHAGNRVRHRDDYRIRKTAVGRLVVEQKEA